MLKAILKTMRPKQWAKNAFLLAAIVFDRQLPSPVIFFTEFRITNLTPLLRTLSGFILFCTLSSVVYIVNDIIDVEADRIHPKKKFRPIASGQLSIPTAITISVILLAITLSLAYMLSWEFFLISVVYFLLNLAYSNYLKHIVLIDVVTLSVGFVLRVAAGVSLINVERFSPWLYIVTTLISLYILFGKRRSELTLLAENATSHRKVLDGYSLPFLDQLIIIVSSTTIMAYSLYTFSAPNLPSNHSMMLTIPFVIYGIFRYLYLIHVKKEGGAPEDLVFKDRPLQITMLLWGLSVLLIFYIF